MGPLAKPYHPTGHSPRAHGLENSHGARTVSDGQDRDDPISATLLTRSGQLGGSASRDAHRQELSISPVCSRSANASRPVAQMTARRANSRARAWMDTA